VLVAVAVGVAVGVRVGVAVSVGVLVRVTVGVTVTVAVLVGVFVAVGVRVTVGEFTAVAVGSCVAVGAGAFVAVGTGVAVAIAVAVDRAVYVGAGVLVAGGPAGTPLGTAPTTTVNPANNTKIPNSPNSPFISPPFLPSGQNKNICQAGRMYTSNYTKFSGYNQILWEILLGIKNERATKITIPVKCSPFLEVFKKNLDL